MKTSHNSAIDLAESLFGVETAKEIQQEINETGTAAILAEMRCKANITQKDFAKKIGTTQSNISKIENTSDENLSLGILKKYCETLGYKLNITFLQNESLTRKVKWHIEHLMHYLDELSALPKNDAAIAAGIHDFLGEISQPLMYKLFNATKHLEQESPDKKKKWGMSCQKQIKERAIEVVLQDSNSTHLCKP